MITTLLEIINLQSVRLNSLSMKQAILITAYKNFEHLESIVKNFNQDFEIYIHIDRKVKIPQIIYKRLMDYPQVKLLIQRYRIYWGDLNHVKAIILLCKEALHSNDIGYIHMISGGDYVVKNIEYFKIFFEQNRHVEFLENFCLPTTRWEGGGLNRLKYFHFNFFFNVQTPRGWNWYKKLLKWQEKFFFKRDMFFEYNIYGGSTWWSLSRECVQYIVNYTETKPAFFRRLRFTFVPEEIYIPTIVMNSTFAKNVINDNIRYTIWEYRNGNIPANLDIRDLKPILISNNIFARKMEYPYASELIDQLQRLNSNFLQLEQKEKILDKESLLQQIANYLYFNATECAFEGLYYGKAGIAVFLFHFAKYTSNNKYSERGYELIANLAEELENIDRLDYSEGIFGLASVLEYLHLNHFIEDDTNELLQEIDGVVLNLINNTNDAMINEMNTIYRLDKYLGFRMQNKQQTTISEESWKQLQASLSPHTFIWSSKEITEYLVQIPLTKGMGIVEGYAGIGFELLADISNDHSWKSLIESSFKFNE